MVLTAQKQLLTKIETTEGLFSSMAVATDGVYVFDVSIQDDIAQIERQPAAAAMGQQFSLTGRRSRRISFTQDFTGTGSAATAPRWGKHLRSCGFAERVPVKYSVTGLTGPFGGGFKLGEKVYLNGSEATQYGICIGASNFVAGAQTIVVQHLAGVNFPPASVIKGKWSQQTAGSTVGAGTTDHFCYIPVTDAIITCTTGAWTPSAAGNAVGEVLAVRRQILGIKEIVGGIQLISDQSAGAWTTLTAALQWGSILNGDEIVNDSGSIAILSANPTQGDIPSLSMRYQRGSLQQDAAGMRGNAVLRFEAGGPLQWNFSHLGILVTQQDGLLVPQSITGLQIPARAIAPSAGQSTQFMCAVSTGTSWEGVGVRSCEIDMGNTVIMRADANGPGGDRTSTITQRNPRIRLTVDNINVFPIGWQLLQQVGISPLQFMVRINAGAGQGVLSCFAPFCQVLDVQEADLDGISGFDVTLAPRLWNDGVITETGHNEIFFSQTSV